jgi:hypothetical protein
MNREQDMVGDEVQVKCVIVKTECWRGINKWRR